MTPQNKLRIANVLMILGTIPLLLGIIWIFSVVTYAQHHKGQMGGSDAFLMMAVLFMTYGFAVVVSGVSALWSTAVAKRNAGLHSRFSTTIRILIYVVLLAPLFGYLGITFILR